MWFRSLQTKSLILVAAALTLIAALACGAAEPAPTPVPASEIAAMVKQAVTEAVPAAPAGPSAAEISSMVSKAVTAAVPKGTSAQEIRSMVEAAVAASAKPGVTRAEMEAAVTRSVQEATAGQLTAPEVRKIVDASVKALPAPQVNVSQLRNLVAQSVADAVPEGVSAAEIQKMVEAAVGAATAGAVTRGEMEAMIAKSVRDTAAGQLSASDVEKIVSASLAATEQAIAATSVRVAEAATAAKAAQAAAQEAVTEAKAATEAAEAAKPAPEPVVTGYVAKKPPPGGFLTWLYDGPIPTELHESPDSADLVRAGKIPKLEDRVPAPQDVRIFPVTDEIGVYGGVRRKIATNPRLGDYAQQLAVIFDQDEIGRRAGIMKFEISSDGRVYTYSLRPGARWSDGYPFTMEDVRFAWEDLNYNPDFGKQSTVFLDPVTGEAPEFKVVDDWTWSLTFDTANFVLLESKTGVVNTRLKSVNVGRTGYFIPAHVFKRFHPKYNGAELPALLTASGKDTWQDLWKDMVNIRKYMSIPSEDIPLKYDPNYIYRGDHYIPGMGAWRHTELTPDGEAVERNYYSIWFDPEGNQLPYLDGMKSFRMESRDVVVFRAMKGEQDNDRDYTSLQELPLYMANMNKGDYSLFTYRDPSGMDVATVVDQEYNEDPYIGSLMRTRDFRIALSLGTDRDELNALQTSGLGTPHNWVPHPSIPYYPGSQYELVDAELNVPRARQILDNLGIKDTDGDGLRNRADGKGNLELFYEAAPATGASFFGVVELLQAQWEKNLGIKMAIKDGRGAANAIKAGTQYFDTRGMMYQANPWAVAWTNLIPLYYGSNSPQVGKYYATRGEEGMAPTGPDPKYTDAYGTMAPEGTYPVDISGQQKRMQEIWTDGISYAQWDPRRIEIGKDIFITNVQQKFVIPYLGFTGWSRGLRFVRNNFRNVTRDVKYQAPETWYFEGGIDNLNHPGNKSKLYKSRTFLDADYWD